MDWILPHQLIEHSLWNYSRRYRIPTVWILAFHKTLAWDHFYFVSTCPRWLTLFQRAWSSHQYADDVQLYWTLHKDIPSHPTSSAISRFSKTARLPLNSGFSQMGCSRHDYTCNILLGVTMLVKVWQIIRSCSWWSSEASWRRAQEFPTVGLQWRGKSKMAATNLRKWYISWNLDL